jgi:hypothetical protein
LYSMLEDKADQVDQADQADQVDQVDQADQADQVDVKQTNTLIRQLQMQPAVLQEAQLLAAARLIHVLTVAAIVIHRVGTVPVLAM